MDTRNLVAWLPFDNSTTFDWCGNEWTLNGALNVDSTNAISGNALQLTGNGDANYLQLDGIALGGRDFTVHAYVYSDTTSNEWARFFAIYDPNNMSSRRICVQATKFEINGSTGGTFTRGTRYHVAIVYQHSTGTLTTFLDGVKQGTKSVTFAAGVLNRIYIGKSEWSGYSTLTGTVDEFIVHDGIALWTENFTPPTAEDYDISDRFTVDLQRRVTNVEDYLVDLQREVNNPLFFRSEYLKVWLPFDRLATEDLCGRDWQAIGTPTIDTTNAVVGNALQLDGSSYLQKTDGITLGGKSFTIHLWCSFESSSGAAATFFSARNSQTGAYLYINRYGTWDYWRINYSDGGTSIPLNWYQCGYDTLNHFAVVYDHDSGELAAYCNGGNTHTYNLTIPETFFDVVRVGTYLQGSIDEVQIYDGIALWTEDFTPPTADFYSLEPSEPVDFTVDLQRRVTNVTIKFKPEVFASWIPTGEIYFKPEVFASWIPTGEIYFKPEVFASIINDGTPLDFTADLSRNVTRTESFTADLQRSLTEVNAFTVDTQRTITRSVNMRVDIQRKLSNAVDFTADAQRSLINRVDFSIDLQRTLVQLNDFTVDLQRQTVWEWLTRILPESSFLDDKMLASAKALDVQITKFHQAIREVLHLPRLDELSGTILDLLAEQFHVDYYDAINFSDAEKRNLIRQSIAWHRLKGTPAAVEMVLQDAFKDLRIDEWFTYGGQPYFFRLWTRGYISTPERFKSFWLMFMDAKNVRSQLEMVTIDHSHDEPIQLYTGVAKVTSGLKIIDLPKHDDAKINLHTGVAIVNVGQKIIGLPKHNDIHTKIYSGVYQIHTGTIFIGMKRNPF